MINILGVDIDNQLTKEEIFLKINKFLDSDQAHYIVTPNPEIILKAQKDEELFHILNQADLSLADGFGLKLAALMSGKSLNRFTGADFVLDLLRIAQNRNKKVLIICNQNGLSSSEDISQALKEKYPQLRFLVQATDFYYQIDESNKKVAIKKCFRCNFLNRIVDRVNKKLEFLFSDKVLDFEADILICNFGAPFQEKFIWHNYKKIPSLRLAIGIGGALDFLTGKIKRAPKWMRFLGLEWLWRLIRQPKRYNRIFRAVFVFPFKFLKWKFISPHFYRKNVACLLYRESKLSYTALENKKRNPLNNYQILLVERVDEPGHWQLPQGGVDAQAIKIAGSRELKEELGIDNFTPKKIFKNVFKYRSNRQGRYGFKGQRQSLLIAEFLGSDADIKLNPWDHSNWKWVRASDLVSEVHPLRKAGTSIFLEKFNNYIIK